MKKALIVMYAPLDGMNEKGLAVSVNMIQDSDIIGQNTEKPDITTTTAIWVLLNRVAEMLWTASAKTISEIREVPLTGGSADHLDQAPFKEVDLPDRVDEIRFPVARSGQEAAFTGSMLRRIQMIQYLIVIAGGMIAAQKYRIDAASFGAVR